MPHGHGSKAGGFLEGIIGGFQYGHGVRTQAADRKRQEEEEARRRRIEDEDRARRAAADRRRTAIEDEALRDEHGLEFFDQGTIVPDTEAVPDVVKRVQQLRSSIGERLTAGGQLGLAGEAARSGASTMANPNLGIARMDVPDEAPPRIQFEGQAGFRKVGSSADEREQARAAAIGRALSEAYPDRVPGSVDTDEEFGLLGDGKIPLKEVERPERMTFTEERLREQRRREQAEQMVDDMVEAGLETHVIDARLTQAGLGGLIDPTAIHGRFLEGRRRRQSRDLIDEGRRLTNEGKQPSGGAVNVGGVELAGPAGSTRRGAAAQTTTPTATVPEAEATEARALVKGMARPAAENALKQAGYSAAEIREVLGG